MNPAAQLLTLNFNFHGIHHANLKLRWYELSDAFREQGKTYDGQYLAAALKQLQGPRPQPDSVSRSVLNVQNSSGLKKKTGQPS